MDIFKNYESLWKSIIRPARQTYNVTDLGPSIMFTKEKRERVRRIDFDLPNKLGLVLKCSFFEFQERQEQQPPCVVYLHCNSGSRLEGQLYVDGLINKGLSVCVFDFAGSGQSEGEYISLGHFELGDVEVVVNYLKTNWRISKIAIWGRSMGAVTGLMYISQDPSIQAAVFDSPFSNFMKLAAEIGSIKTGLPKFLIKGALSLIQSTIQEKAGFDLSTLNVLPHIQSCKVPCLFVVSKKDNFVKCRHSEKIRLNYTGESAITYFEGDHNEQRPLGVVKECINYFHARLMENNSNTSIQQTQSNSQLQPQQLKHQFQLTPQQQQKQINLQEMKQNNPQQLEKRQQMQVQQKQQLSEQPQQPKLLRTSQENFHKQQQIGNDCYPQSTRALSSNLSSHVSSSTTINSFRMGSTQQEIQQRQQNPQPSSVMTGSIHHHHPHHSHTRSTASIMIQSDDPKTTAGNNFNPSEQQTKTQKNNMSLNGYTATLTNGLKAPQQAQLVVPKISFSTNNLNSCIKQTAISPTSEQSINQFNNNNANNIFGKVSSSQQYNQDLQKQNQQPQNGPSTTENAAAITPIRGETQATGRDRTHSTFSSAVEGLGVIFSNSKMPSAYAPQPQLLDSQRSSQQNGIIANNSNSNHNNHGMNDFMQYSLSKQANSSQSGFVLPQQQQVPSQPQTTSLQESNSINNLAYSQVQQFPLFSKIAHSSSGLVQTLSNEESKKPVQQPLPTHFRQKSGFVSYREPANVNSPSILTLPNEASSRYRSTTADQVANNSIEQTSMQAKAEDHQIIRQPSFAALSTNRLRTQNPQHPPVITQLITFDSARKPTEESKFQNPTLISYNNAKTHDKSSSTQREIMPQISNETMPTTRTSHAPLFVSVQSLVSPRLNNEQCVVKNQNNNANNSKNSIDFDRNSNSSMLRELKTTANSNSHRNDSHYNIPLLLSKDSSGQSNSTKNLAFLTGSKSRSVLQTNGKGKSLLNQTPLWLLTETNNPSSGSINTPQPKTASAQMNYTNSSSNNINNSMFPGNNTNNSSQGAIAVNAFSFNGDSSNQPQKTDFSKEYLPQQAPLLSQRTGAKITSTGKVPRISPSTDVGSFWQSRHPVIVSTSNFNVHQNNNSNNVDNHILQTQNLNALPKQNNHENNLKITSPSAKFSNQSHMQQSIQVQQLILPQSVTSAGISGDSKGVFSMKQPNNFDFKNKRTPNNIPISLLKLSNDENACPRIETQDASYIQNQFKYPTNEVQKHNINMSASKTGAVANIPRETLPPFYWALEQKNQSNSEENTNSSSNNQQQQVEIKEQQTQNLLLDAEAIKKSRSSTTPTFKPDFIRNLQSTKVLHVLPNTQKEPDAATPYCLQNPQTNASTTTTTTNLGVIRQHQYSVHEVNQASKTSAAFYKTPIYQNL